MKIIIDTIFGIAVCIAIIAGVAFGLNAAGYISYSFWAPKHEAVRRDVMVQSRAYVEASAREMYRFQLQYNQAHDETERNAVKAFALHEANGMDVTTLPKDLQDFVKQLRAN